MGRKLTICDWVASSTGNFFCIEKHDTNANTQIHTSLMPHFIATKLQEVMRNPHTAADGYTYEAEAIKGWLDSGHETSPMTKLPLVHRHVTPSYAVRSAIQNYMQQHQQKMPPRSVRSTWCILDARSSPSCVLAQKTAPRLVYILVVRCCLGFVSCKMRFIVHVFGHGWIFLDMIIIEL